MPVGTPPAKTREVITRLERTALDMLEEVDVNGPPMPRHYWSITYR